ncbi:MAG: Putative phospholipase A1 [Pseudidiomarina mangrovi]|nr:MAG: Putative phospholipase A1 [Pseudidiomarina mangrovi]
MWWSNKLQLLSCFISLMVLTAPSYAQSSQDVDDHTDLVGEFDLLGTFWELSEEQKRGTFQLRTHQPNFILVAHHTSEINKQPTSPTRGDSVRIDTYKPNEVKLQISLRTKVMEDFLLPNADVWVSYTQTSLWQMWNPSDSAPFRSTDYNPDVFYIVPVTEQWDFLPGDARVRYAKVGFAHESNGNREPDSRSWNYLHFGGAAQFSDFIWESTFKQRINEVGDQDDNPDLVRFRGSFENRIAWINGTDTYSLTRVSRDLSFNRGSWQFDFTMPFNSDKPEGLRFYVQLFSGYGETLLDYNHRQNRIGLGFLLLNF